MPYLSLTTWSLHRNLGPLRWTRWDAQNQCHIIEEQEQPETITLLELPKALADKGFRSLEVCHFHFPSTEHDYLSRLKQSFQDAGMTFYTLLVDYGDISSNDSVRRNADLQFIKSWIDIAAQAGAERVRVVAGESSPNDQEALERSAAALQELSHYAKQKGVRVVTENFLALSSTPENCLYLLRESQEQIGLTADFGNFKQPGKYEALAAVLPYAESVHAKAAHNEEGEIDAEEFRNCLDLAAQAGYEGPLTLVYDGPGDLWEGIQRTREVVEPYVTILTK